MTRENVVPWAGEKTSHGFAADQVISALQKEIRRGNTENACLLAYEMVITSPALEDCLWYRLMAISVEDIGFGQLQAAVLINALWQMLCTTERQAWEHRLFAIHAVRYLCGCKKDRSSAEMTDWITLAVESGKTEPLIPEYALDMHTVRGRELGRGKRHFWAEGTELHPELPNRDLTYHQRILAMLDSGEMAD
jgi:replication-associated recombination protein RarA